MKMYMLTVAALYFFSFTQSTEEVECERFGRSSSRN